MTIRHVVTWKLAAEDVAERGAQAAEVARRLNALDGVVPQLLSISAGANVAYPELESHPDHALAQKLLSRGAGSVFSFTLKGGRAAGRKFIEALRVFSHLANVGDAKSLVIHPASTTHFRMSDEALVAAGIHPGTIRLSIGLEDAGDLLEDLNRGLAAAQKA